MARTLQCLWPSGVSPQEALQHPLFVNTIGCACTGSNHGETVSGSGATTEEECQGLLLPDPSRDGVKSPGQWAIDALSKMAFVAMLAQGAQARSTRVMS